MVCGAPKATRFCATRCDDEWLDDQTCIWAKIGNGRRLAGGAHGSAVPPSRRVIYCSLANSSEHQELQPGSDPVAAQEGSFLNVAAPGWPSCLPMIAAPGWPSCLPMIAAPGWLPMIVVTNRACILVSDPAHSRTPDPRIMSRCYRACEIASAII